MAWQAYRIKPISSKASCTHAYFLFAAGSAPGEKHPALKLRHRGQPVDGIWFGHTEPLPARVQLAFRLDADEWQGVRRVRFLVEGGRKFEGRG